MLFSAQKQNKTGTWKTRGFVQFGPIKYQRGPWGAGARAPGAGDAADGRPCASGWPPLAAPSSARRPTPLRTRSRSAGLTCSFPRTPARYPSGHFGGSPRGSSCAFPKPARPPSRASCGLPRQAPPRGPASGESVPPAQVRSGDGIRCQRGGQTPPVGGGATSLTSFHPRLPPARAGRSPSAPLPGPRQGASPPEAEGGAAGARRGSGVWVTLLLGLGWEKRGEGERAPKLT